MEQESQNKKLEETAYEPSYDPILCPNNCGFIVNSSTKNLCSKCYQHHIMSQSKDSDGSADMTDKMCEDEIVDKSSDGNEATRKGAGVGVEAGSSENPEKRHIDKCGDRRKQEAFVKAKREAMAKVNPAVKADKFEKF